jgi:ribose-phosphate pyrophosphokinase
MPHAPEPKLIAGNANLPLANAIAAACRCIAARSGAGGCPGRTVQRPGDLRRGVRERARRGHVHHPADLEPANDNLMELLIMSDALRRSSARADHRRDPLFRLCPAGSPHQGAHAHLGQACGQHDRGGGIERVLTMDLHAAQIQGFFDIPVDNLYASPVFALDIQTQFKGDVENDGRVARRGRRGPRARACQADRGAAVDRRQAPREGGRSGRDDRDR